jgi:hypothetical protein
MSDLLTTDDERDLVAFLCGELGAKLLLTDVAAGGEPSIAADPLAALPATLPGPAVFGSKEVRTVIFWLAACGPIKTLRDAPAPSSAKEQVARILTRDHAAGQFDDVIDLERTPVLLLSRSHWHGRNRLAPGTLGPSASSRNLREDVKRASLMARRRLQKRGVKTDPFTHCPEVKDRRPARLGPLWVWVQPHAMALVKQGIEIWPWNG